MDGQLGLLGQFAGMRVLVVGEAMLDSYLDGTTPRLCREAPVPVVDVEGRQDTPGGAANTAVNVAALGAEVTFLSVTGADAEGVGLARALEERGAGARAIVAEPGRRTQAKTRVVADGQLVVRFDQGDTGPVAPASERRMISALAAEFPKHDAVIISDYGYGVVTPRLLHTLARLQRQHHRVLVADSRRLGAYREVGCTAVKPNYEEALALLGIEDRPGARGERLADHGALLYETTGAEVVALTLDREGALIFDRGQLAHRAMAPAVPRARVAGAGDTFTAAFALALAAGAPLPDAADLAAAAAAVVVTKEGTAVCNRWELRERLLSGARVIDDAERLAASVAAYRAMGRRVVFTNGCFDILHAGHISYLNQARGPRDVLFVGLNSDESVRRLKGDSRPVNSLDDRARVLAALNCVDHVVPFDEDTPEALIQLIRPDVYVKGGDYTVETLPEAPLVAELGGTVQILPYVDDWSTTRIIARIQQGPGRPDERETDGRAGRMGRGTGDPVRQAG